MEEKRTKQIEVLVKECKTKDGRDFLGYKVVCKDGRLMDVSFCRNVKAIEKNSIITAYEEDLSLDKNRKYPRLYIRGYISADEIVYDSEIKDEDLPF